MKWLVILALGLLVAACADADQEPVSKPQSDVVLNSISAKESYAVGVQVGLSLKHQATTLDVDSLIRGIKDAFTGQKLLMSDADLDSTMSRFLDEQKASQAAAAKEAGSKNQQQGDTFMAANRSKPGVVVLPSGLQYKILKMGDGKKPTAADTVTVNYRGTLIDGTEFDSSYKRGEPATFPVNGVIAGWTEALQLMPVGSKWQLFIPPQLAYGPEGAGQMIGPNATLIFEVELLGIK